MTITQQLTDLNAAKIAIKSAIEAKGVTVGNIPLSSYPSKISVITTASGYGYTSKTGLINFDFI